MKDTLFVFDIDGTLTDSLPSYIMAVSRSLLALGIKDIDMDYHNYKHHTDSYALRYNFERNFSDPYSTHVLEQFEVELVKQMQDDNPLDEIKGAVAFINYLRSKEIPFCFATGALPAPSKHKLDQCNIWYHEDILATSKISEAREGFVLKAIQMAKSFYGKTSFSKIYSVGDGIWDYQTAKNLELDFIGIGTQNLEKFKELGVKLAFEDIERMQNNLFLESMVTS